MLNLMYYYESKIGSKYVHEIFLDAWCVPCELTYSTAWKCKQVSLDWYKVHLMCMHVEGKCHMLYCIKDLIHQCFVPLLSLYSSTSFTVLGGHLSILQQIVSWILSVISPHHLFFYISIPSIIPDAGQPTGVEPLP